jgi:hypothetical protein
MFQVRRLDGKQIPRLGTVSSGVAYVKQKSALQLDSGAMIIGAVRSRRAGNVEWWWQ